MTTGRIDYAPDYKSHCGMSFPVFAEFCGKCGASLEKVGLEREVIDAAKAERLAARAFNNSKTPENYEALFPAQERRKAAVDKLLEFEERENR